MTTKPARKPSAAELFALLADTQAVSVLYSGDCRGCGGCCSRFLPITQFEAMTLRNLAHLRPELVHPEEEGSIDLRCPFLDDAGECSVYEHRPSICRAYRCDLHAAGTMPFPRGMGKMRAMDMRKVIE